jgi:hypothetical protein
MPGIAFEGMAFDGMALLGIELEPIALDGNALPSEPPVVPVLNPLPPLSAPLPPNSVLDCAKTSAGIAAPARQMHTALNPYDKIRDDIVSLLNAAGLAVLSISLQFHILQAATV